MAVAPGTHIGPYEVLALIGAGGMGEVYRVRDTRLRREVALKTLPLAVAGDSDRQRRFEHEALAIGRLNHPNVLVVHDVGTHEGVSYIVTELVEGETLREKIRGQPIAPQKAIEYGVQIARGLAAAHEQGIVHRDVKPDNLLITRDGRVKILDFGLARLIDPETAHSGAATITIAGIGPVLGTAAYMAPEQARGLRADHRADIFSLGVVLYEMLSGVSPFRRDTTADTISAILHEEPPTFTATILLTPALERIVRHCLEKDPENRFQNARDLAFDLETALHATTPLPAAPDRRPSSALRKVLPLIVALGVGAAAGYFARSAGRGGRVPAEIPRIHRVTDFAGFEESPSVSPDRKAVAFSAYVDGRRQIFVRLVAAGAPLQLTRGASDHTEPRWSPDSSSLVYFAPATPGDAQGTIWEIPALGGSPRRVVDSMGSCDVSRKGRLACFRLAGGRVELVTHERDGSDTRVAYRPEGRPAYHRYPRWSPDTRSIAFQRGDGVRYDVFVAPADGDGTARQLTHDNSQMNGLAWLPDSSGVVYSSSRGSTVPYLPIMRLWSIARDAETPTPLIATDLSYLHPDIAPSGTIAATRVQMSFDIWKFPVDGPPADNVGRAARVTRQTGQVQTPTNAPGDKAIAFLSDSGGHANLWVLDTATGELRQITHESDPAVALGVPVWSPDGKEIAFVSSRGNTGFGFGIWTIDPDGGNLRNLVKQGLGMAWSPDSSWLYYSDSGVFWKIPRAGGRPVRVRPEATRNVIGVHGSAVYFMVDRALVDGRPEFEIRVAAPEDGPSRAIARVPASRLPGWQIANPTLSPDGAWLAVPLTDGVTTNIWAVSTATGEWKQITDFGERATFIARRVTWSADGRAIYAAVGEGDADIVLLEGVLNPPR